MPGRMKKKGLAAPSPAGSHRMPFAGGRGRVHLDGFVPEGRDRGPFLGAMGWRRTAMAVFPPAGGLSSLSAASVLLRAFFLRGLWGAAALWRPGIHSGLLGGGVLPGLRPGWLCRFPLAGSGGRAAHHPLYAGAGRKCHTSGFEESAGKKGKAPPGNETPAHFPGLSSYSAALPVALPGV